jgi:hypothetical protein
MVAKVVAEAAIALAWSHWTALGVSGVVPPPDTAVDPEALILLTAVIADHDPRLRDEALDWCVQFGKQFIAAGRMRTLSRSLDAEAAARCHVFAATVNAAAGTHWPSDSAKARALSPSGKSRLSRLDTPQRALLRVRCAFGMTARAEVLLSMLTQWNPSNHVKASSFVELGYGKTAAATTLDELTLAGITSRRTIGNANAYQLRRPGELKKLLEPLPVRQGDWHLRLILLIAAVRLEEVLAKKSPIVQSVEARKFVEARTQVLARLSLEPPAIADPRQYWEQLRGWLAGAFAT